MGGLRGLEVSIVSYNYLDFTSEANHVRPKNNMLHKCSLAVKLDGSMGFFLGFYLRECGSAQGGNL